MRVGEDLLVVMIIYSSLCVGSGGLMVMFVGLVCCDGMGGGLSEGQGVQQGGTSVCLILLFHGRVGEGNLGWKIFQADGLEMVVSVLDWFCCLNMLLKWMMIVGQSRTLD